MPSPTTHPFVRLLDPGLVRDGALVGGGIGLAAGGGHTRAGSHRRSSPGRGGAVHESDTNRRTVRGAIRVFVGKFVDGRADLFRLALIALILAVPVIAVARAWHESDFSRDRVARCSCPAPWLMRADATADIRRQRNFRLGTPSTGAGSVRMWRLSM